MFVQVHSLELSNPHETIAIYIGWCSNITLLDRTQCSYYIKQIEVSKVSKNAFLKNKTKHTYIHAHTNDIMQIDSRPHQPQKTKTKQNKMIIFDSETDIYQCFK